MRKSPGEDAGGQTGWSMRLRHGSGGRYENCTPATMLRCLEIKGVVKQGRLQLEVADEPPAEITEALVAELMSK